MSLHADAVATLSEWTAPDTHQAELRRMFLDHLAGFPDAMTRACRPAHLTAGVLVLDDAGEHVLLNLHRKARRWFHFGGHCEPGDATLFDAARREGVEESGITDLQLDPVPLGLDRHTVEFCGDLGAVDHYDVRFTARVPAGAAARISEESLDIRWWPVDALPDDVEDEMRLLVRAALARWTSTPTR